MPERETPGRVGATCPICRRPARAEARPFCSERCAQRDLGNWLTGSYAVPAAEEDDTTSQDAAEDGGAMRLDSPTRLR